MVAGIADAAPCAHVLPFFDALYGPVPESLVPACTPSPPLLAPMLWRMMAQHAGLMCAVKDARCHGPVEHSLVWGKRLMCSSRDGVAALS